MLICSFLGFSLGAGPFTVFSSAVLVGEFGARGTRYVIEYSRLKTTPEPGHLCR